MMNKRQILLALAALGAGAGVAAAQPALDLAGGAAIGAAYRAAHSNADLAPLRAIIANGIESALPTLRTRVAADFSRGATFVHAGWRMSETEAQLFALLA